MREDEKSAHHYPKIAMGTFDAPPNSSLESEGGRTVGAHEERSFVLACLAPCLRKLELKDASRTVWTRIALVHLSCVRASGKWKVVLLFPAKEERSRVEHAGSKHEHDEHQGAHQKLADTETARGDSEKRKSVTHDTPPQKTAPIKVYVCTRLLSNACDMVPFAYGTCSKQKSPL